MEQELYVVLLLVLHPNVSLPIMDHWNVK